MTRRAAAFAAAAVLTLGACGTTYIDTSATTSPDPAATTVPAVDPDAPLPELLDELESLMRHFDEQIVDDEDVPATMARIDAVWDAAEQQIRDRDPDDLYAFEQAITLARLAVERRRPADASRGYRLLLTAIDTYPAARSAEIGSPDPGAAAFG